MNTQTQTVTKEQGAQLRRDVRAAISSHDADRSAQAQTAYTQWREQWEEQNPEATEAAQQKRADRDAATIARQDRRDAVARQSIANADVMLEQEEERREEREKGLKSDWAREEAEYRERKAKTETEAQTQRAASAEAEKMQIETEAEAQRQRADRAEADRADRHQQTFKLFDESILASKPDDFVYTVETFLEAFEVPNHNRKTVTEALTNWAKSCGKRPNHTPRQRWELDREQAQLFYENYIGKGRHQKRHALRAKNK